MTQSWYDRFAEDTGKPRLEPQGLRTRPPTQADIRCNIARLLGDTIEALDTMIYLRDKLVPKVAAMRDAGIDWPQLAELDEHLQLMQVLNDDLTKARPLHRFLDGSSAPHSAFRMALDRSDRIVENATNLCSDMLSLHHALEAVEQRMLLEKDRVTRTQGKAMLAFAKQRQALECQPHTEAQTLAAAVMSAEHEMRAITARAETQAKQQR